MAFRWCSYHRVELPPSAGQFDHGPTTWVPDASSQKSNTKVGFPAGPDIGVRRYDPTSQRVLELDQYQGALSDLQLSADPLNQNRYRPRCEQSHLIRGS
jgi:hypothetical protein